MMWCEDEVTTFVVPDDLTAEHTATLWIFDLCQYLRTGMLDDDSKLTWGAEDEDDDAVPEWADEKLSSDRVVADDTSYLMMRMSSHFLSTTQPELESFAQSRLKNFFNSASNQGSSTHSLRQYDTYLEYTEIFERSMKSFLDESSKEEILEALKAANSKAKDGRESMGTIMLELISALSSFEGETSTMLLH